MRKCYDETCVWCPKDEEDNICNFSECAYSCIGDDDEDGYDIAGQYMTQY